jgi:hypothetical protein
MGAALGLTRTEHTSGELRALSGIVQIVRTFAGC